MKPSYIIPRIWYTLTHHRSQRNLFLYQDTESFIFSSVVNIYFYLRYKLTEPSLHDSSSMTWAQPMWTLMTLGCRFSGCFLSSGELGVDLLVDLTFFNDLELMKFFPTLKIRVSSDATLSLSDRSEGPDDVMLTSSKYLHLVFMKLDCLYLFVQTRSCPAVCLTTNVCRRYKDFVISYILIVL